MAQLGSEFLKPLDTYERPVISFFSLRQIILLAGLILTISVTVLLFWLRVPDLATYPLIILTLAPFAIFGLQVDEVIKDNIRFMLTQQDRTYQTDFDRKDYTTHDFHQDKTVSELIQG